MLSSPAPLLPSSPALFLSTSHSLYIIAPSGGSSHMKRLAVLSALLVAAGLCLAVGAQQTQPASLQISQVKENLYMISGAGGNTAAYIADRGVVVVDTKLPNNGPAILEKIKSVTPKPVIMVINTHTHGDHVGSNSGFTGAVEFIAQENCKASMEKMPAFQSEEGKKFLPSKTYKDKLSVLSGKDKIDLYYFGPGHTSGDTLVVFPGLRTMHAGDLYAWKDAPIIDGNNGGNAIEYPKTLAKAAAGIKNVDTVIPGHTPVTDFNAFKEYGDFMKELVAAIQESKKQGKTAADAAAEFQIPAKYQGYTKNRVAAAANRVYADTK